MTKSLAEEIRSLMHKMEEAAANYDLELKVENWNYPEDPDDTTWPEFITLGINYKIVGSYRPATWGDRGGDPAEYPELDQVEIFDASTGQPIEIPQSLENYVEEKIWAHAESMRDHDYEPPYDNDRY